VRLYDFLANRQPEAHPRGTGAKALKRLENLMEILWLDAYAIVSHGKTPLILLPLSRYVNARRFRTLVQQCVT